MKLPAFVSNEARFFFVVIVVFVVNAVHDFFR
jgi:hypothetical protein